jgi:hypothetical protein
VQDYPNNPAWAIKCQREYANIMKNVKGYLGLAKEMPK